MQVQNYIKKEKNTNVLFLSALIRLLILLDCMQHLKERNEIWISLWLQPKFHPKVSKTNTIL